MKKKDNLNNVNEIEFEQLPNMPEAEEPDKLQETEEPKVLRSAILCVVTIAVLALTIGLVIFLFNKSTKKPVDNTGNNEEVTQVAEEVEEQPTMEPTPSKEPEVVEPEPSEEPEVTEPQTAYEWIVSIEGTGHPVSIWNDNTKVGTIIEDEGQYYITEGDKLLIEHNMATINIPSAIVIESSNTIYAMCSISELPEYLSVKINSEVAQEYHFYVTTEDIDPVLPIDLGNDSEEPNYEITSEGERWVASLTYDEPKLVIFNDGTGVNTVLEDGETYQMQPGDQMAAYFPEGYAFRSIICNYEDYNYIINDNYVLIMYEYKGLTENKLYFFNPDDSTSSYTYEILPAN